METNWTACNMGMTVFPSHRLVFLAAALLLLSPGPATGEEELNMPPDGFTALFNGKDFTGWQLSPLAHEAWSIEDGILKSHGGFKDYSATLVTDKKYRDFVLLADYREPSMSVSGIWFRGWPAGLPKTDPEAAHGEKVNICSLGWMGHPLVFHYLPPHIKLKEEQHPQVKHISPEIGVWHTIKLTLIGRTLSIEVDGEVILDEFEYPEGLLSMAPGIVGLQKHQITEMAGTMSDCPIEYRNLFIREIESSE